jgi:multisubunit Na+/H+ antiporter MnhC subunit
VAGTIVQGMGAVAIVIGFAMFAILLLMIEGIDRV